MGDNVDSRRASPVKTRRSRRGCLTCRQRKVKCDETRDVCRNCFRLDARCTWETPGDNEPGRRRSRNWRACARCRDKKLRCTAPSSGPGCGQCLKAGTACDALSSATAEVSAALSFTASNGSGSGSAGGKSNSSASAATKENTSDIVPRAELLRILDAYFDGPHYFCYSTFLHRPSFMKMLDNGLIPRSLLLIVLATGLQVMGASAGNLERSTRADAWADESRSLVVLDVFARISTTNLQTLLLLQRYEWHRGVHLGAWFLSGVAYRLAHALQLHLEPADVVGADTKLKLPPSVVETRRRLIWSCYVMDSVPDAHQSGARPLQSVLDPGVIRSRLPCDEVQYERGEPDRDDKLSSPSISAYLIRMVILRQRILTYSGSMRCAAVEREENAAKYGGVDIDMGTGSDHRVWPWHDGSDFHALKQQLDGLAADLPAIFQLRSHASVPHHARTAFYTLHAMFHAAYTDLLRIGTFVARHMPPSTTRPRRGSVVPPPAFVHACKVEQLKHACGIAHVVAQCLQSLPSEHDPFVAICSCLAIRILVMERWRETSGGPAVGTNAAEVLSWDDARVKDGMAACLEAAKRTARWSMPIRKLLLAVGDLARQYGHLLDLDEFRPPTQRLLPLTPPPVSRGPPPRRPTSPNLRLYGTSGSIQRARDAHDREVVQSVEVVEKSRSISETEFDEAVAAAATTLAHPVPQVAHSDSSVRSSLSAEALQIASNWADGTYDVPMAQTNFDWGTFEFGMNFVPMGDVSNGNGNGHGNHGIVGGGLAGHQDTLQRSISGSISGSLPGSIPGHEVSDVLNVGGGLGGGLGSGLGVVSGMGVPGVEFGIADGEGLDLHFGFY